MAIEAQLLRSFRRQSDDWTIGRLDDQPGSSTLHGQAHRGQDIFFLAFLPQFVAAERGPIAVQILTLGVIFVAATFLVFSAIAWLSGTFGALLLRSSRTQGGLNWFADAVFLALAVRLVTSHI
ncbi:hypothetical protein RM96_29715 [Cupriavidus sp. IDO]|nr:hypothetical protein [Cupriavidus sp. IDO]KWR80283.1 hypothetical protein RM96_29715 [Cupriavidus sp. IDO]